VNVIIWRVPIVGPFNPAQLISVVRRSALVATRRVRPDHRAVALRSVTFSPMSMGRLYLYVVLAPSRYAPRPFDPQQVSRAQAFATDAFPGVFDTVPNYADDSQVLFAVEAADGYRERALYIHPTGAVELLWALTCEEEDDEIRLDATEMTTLIAQVADAVGRRPWTELSKAGRGYRRFARVDWNFNLATRVAGDAGPRAWTGLTFVGEAPPRASGQSPGAPVGGYGRARLRNSRRTKPGEEIARIFLAEMLTASGYYEFDHAISRTIESVRAARAALTSRG
jgi:hypothetical protein